MSCPVNNFLIYEQMKGFLKYMEQMFTIIRQYDKHNNQFPTRKVNVKVEGQRLTYSVMGYILCSVHNFFIDQGILKLCSH
jgi:hypothetical protein